MDRRDDLNPNRKVNQPGVTDTTGDVVGEVTGGVAGAATGAALGSLGGPVGTLIGALAGAIGGWWSGRAISEAASSFTDDDESYYRTRHSTLSSQYADRTTHAYDDVRPAYQLGHLASRNPDYANRSWDEVERDLQRGWSGDVAARHGDWHSVRHYARDAYERGRSNASNSSLGASTATGSTAYAAGRTADRLDTAGDRVENALDRTGDKIENAWDRTKAGAERLGDKIADKVDDTKDRVDANPASRPGPDATDSPRRY